MLGKKIMIIGCCGSEKSTLGKKKALAQIWGKDEENEWRQLNEN